MYSIVFDNRRLSVSPCDQVFNVNVLVRYYDGKETDFTFNNLSFIVGIYKFYLRVHKLDLFNSIFVWL